MSEKNCGHCKHYQLDGMFGAWCDIDSEHFHNAEKCENYRRNVIK